MRKLLQKQLRWMARMMLRKYRPIVVGITGSVGKTTTKEAVCLVLSDRFNVRGSLKNYNNEIGVPLTILGQKSPGNSLFGWMRLFLLWVYNMVFSRPYPQVLVLEMAIDRPGDMEYLLSVVRPDVGIATGISASHLEFFGSLEAIAQEKGKMIEAVANDGVAILNADDPLIWDMRKRTQSRIISYGRGQKAELSVFNEAYPDNPCMGEGISCKIDYRGKSIPLRLKKIISGHHLDAILAALAVGEAFRMNLLSSAQSLEFFALPPGRLQAIEGLQSSCILDDTYNASPVSTSAALKTLGEFSSGRRVAILGDMLELGTEEESGHRMLAEAIEKNAISYVIAVGKRMRFLVDELQARGFHKDNLHVCMRPMEAAAHMRNVLELNDIILVKGSQGMRMEKVVEKIMARPEEASQLLCRQESTWKEIPFEQP